MITKWRLRSPHAGRLARFIVCVAFFAAACADNVEGEGSDGASADVGGADVEADATSSDVGGDAFDAGADAATDAGADGSLDAGAGDAGGGDGQTEEDAAEDVDAGPVELSVSAVTPGRGPVEGGTPFVIEGAGFTEETVVYFGSRRATATRVDGKLVGDTPAGPGVGPVNVKLIDGATGTDTLQDGFTYTATLRITAVEPARIPTPGGVEVVVTGAGFDPQTRVSFGGESALRHEWVDANRMRVLAPAHPAGRVDVRVTGRDGTDVAPGAVAYFEPIQIDAVRPATGSTAGGESVELWGRGFADGMSVEFGGVPATAVSVNAAADRASVQTPAGSAGLVDVRVQRLDGSAAIAADAYYYTSASDPFSIAAISPDVSGEGGGVAATLVGAGLDAPGLTVSFGGVPAPRIIEQGAGHAVVEVPPGAPGVVDVRAEDGQGRASTLADAFTYVDALRLSAASPGAGPTAGGTTVTLDGEGFTGVTRVAFGGVPAAFQVDDDATITATAPARAAGRVDIVVERGAIDARLADAFTYEAPLEVYSMTPVRGSVAGNTYVEIVGAGFDDTVDVAFGGVAAPVVDRLDAQTLAVRTPPGAPGSVDVSVTRGAEQADAPEPYTYFNPGSRFGGSWGGPILGAVNVTVYAQGGSPIEGAYVQLSTNPATTYAGTTDQNGMVTLSGPDVFGAQTVTATAVDYSSATVQDVDAENITIFLSPPPSQGPPPPGPPVATYQGRLTGLDKIEEPGPTEIPVAYVTSTTVDAWSRNPSPGPGATVYNDGPYSITTRIGDLALVAVGGLYDNATDEFRPLIMGVERYLFASGGQTYNVDIDMTIPLDQTVRYKVQAPPLRAAGPDVHRVMPFLDFGFEGVWRMLTFAEGAGDVVEAEHQAALTGLLADVKYFAMGGAYTGGNAPPLSIAFKENITDINQVVTMPVSPTPAYVTSPLDGQVPTNGLVQLDVDASFAPDFYYVRVVTFQQATVYEAFLPGSATRFRFPDFPDFSNLAPEDRPVPYPGGTYQMLIIGVNQQGASIDDWSYADLSLDGWESYSLWTQILSF